MGNTFAFLKALIRGYTKGATTGAFVTVSAAGADHNTLDVTVRDTDGDEFKISLIDYDTGGGTVNLPVVGIGLPGAGGPVAGGTATNPVVVTGSFAATLPATSAVTSVADNVASTQLLASNASRRAFRVYNDSTSVVYIKYGTTASSTDFTVMLDSKGYLEENFYSGKVDAIWASAPGGAARITELS